MALILIVEDAWFSRRVLCKVLQGSGHQTLEASNGREGLEMALAHKPECMFLDLLMPEMDGFEVLKTLQEQGSQLPVIVLTADIQETTRQQCFELGAMAVLNKPVVPDQLREWIKKALSSKRGEEGK